MDDLPAVAIRSWRRASLACLVVWTPSLAVGGYAVFIQQWRPFGPGWLINLAVMAFLVSVLLRWTIGIITSRVFHRLGTAHRLLAQQKNQEARAELEKYLAFVERHPWLDRWRTVLFLFVQKHSLRELAWINIGFIHMRHGDMERRRAAYEQCLAINPRNEMAIDNLNLTAAFAGEPLRPGGSGLTFFDAVDYKQARRQANIILIVVVAVLFCQAPVVGSLGMMFMGDMQNTVASLIPVDAPWYVTGIVVGLALFFLLRILTALYRLAATRLVLFDLYRANRLAKAGRPHDAVKALEVQRAFFDEHPWADTLRWLLMLSPTTYSYREWASISLADIYLDLGDTGKYIDYNMECLIQNPSNAFARSRLEFCNTILGGLNKPLISIPARQAG